MSCSSGPGATHYAGCECHEAEWQRKLDAAMARAEAVEAKSRERDAACIESLRLMADQVRTVEAERDDWHKTADRRSAEIVRLLYVEADRDRLRAALAPFASVGEFMACDDLVHRKSCSIKFSDFEQARAALREQGQAECCASPGGMSNGRFPPAPKPGEGE